VTEHAVVIVGAGPTGMMLAAELTLAGADVAVVERRTTKEAPGGSRSGGLHARSIEVLDQRGVADRFLSAGTVAQVATFSMIPLDISDFPTRHNYGLALWQNQFEQILAEWIDELGVRIHRGCEVTGFTQDDAAVTIAFAGGESWRAQYVVGCDGGRSVIRKAAGIAFGGWEATTSSLVAEVEMAEEPELGVIRDHRGIHGIGKLEDGRLRLVVREEELSQGDATLDDLSQALIAVRGTDYGVRNPTWISRFTDAARQAASYRNGRALLAGDAAHVHSPIGGQGLNTGLQDAVNLGWKLAQVVKGASSPGLLDSYHDERHPVAARVLQNTLAATALSPAEPQRDALREIVSTLLSMEEPRKWLAGMMSGLDIRYDVGDGHPLLGRRMPDLDLQTERGPQRTYELLHDAQPLLLNLGERNALDITGWTERVRLVTATHGGEWQLPVIGKVDAPGGVLIRPDGHVAWVGDGTDAGLHDALTRWFG
jgi:3-(3-hydroxy-phenyl)propionate hydroxylase